MSSDAAIPVPVTSNAIVDQALGRVPLPPRSALEDLAAVLGPFVVVDLETTGLDPATARAIEIGAVRVTSGGSAEIYHSLVDPGIVLPTAIEHLTGIRASDLLGQPRWDEVAIAFARFASGCTVLAHNAVLERALLGPLLPNASVFLDTLELACVLRPELPSHALAALVRESFDRQERHRALDDALDTLAVLVLLRGEIVDGEHDVLGRLLATGTRSWSWAPFFSPGTIAGETTTADRPRSTSRPPFPLLTPSAPATAAGVTFEGRRSAVERYSADFVRICLTDERRWQTVFPGYRAREGQIELALDILRAFQSDGAFAAEAGTGIGKTLAYCLVALLHADATGERVVISSANKTLQGRIVEEELPRIAAAIGVPEPRAVVMKGRANYGNAARAREIAARPEAFGFASLSEAGRLYLTTFFARCPERDLHALGGWLLHQDDALWAIRDRIACHADCNETACRALATQCAYLQRVDALDSAQIVSINHSLLLKWPERYGPISRLIVDEAHELAAEGDRAFAEEVGSRDLRPMLVQLAPTGSGGLVLALGHGAGDPALGRRAGDLARRLERRLASLGDRLFEAVQREGPVVPRSGTEVQGGAWAKAARSITEFAAELESFAEMLERLAGSYRDRLLGEFRRDDALSSTAAVSALAIDSAAHGLLADLFVQTRPATVYAAHTAERRDSARDWRLTATPLETAGLIHARVIEPARTVVAVSATLGISGDLRPSLEKIGWESIPASRKLVPRRIPPPFDFPRRSVLAFVRGPAYDRPQFTSRAADAILEIARLLGGRTMALFTNRRRLGDVANRLQVPLAAEGIALLTQDRPGGAARLVEQLAADPQAVLLGLRSLWQGVDVPGDALSCVVIEKLPFPHRDALLRGREEVLRRAGGDEFRSLVLEPAVIGFKQMFGRLIRSESDRGFVVVLGADTTMSYIDDFVRSLPGPPRVVFGEIDEILAEMRAFFADLRRP
jgi:ATP-dependent DNA helicase DinG